jgi:hypothetical protein
MVEIQLTHITEDFTRERLYELFNKGWVIAGQVMVKGPRGEGPGETGELIPVNIWARHTGAMLGVQVASALDDAYTIYVRNQPDNASYTPADVLEYLSKSLLGISAGSIASNVEVQDEPVEESEL